MEKSLLRTVSSLLIFLLGSIVTVAVTSTVEEQFTFGAIVVEYHPKDDIFTTPEEKLQARTKYFLQLLKGTNNDSDIILFPENALVPFGDPRTLSSEVPKPFEAVLCNSTDTRYKDYLKEFSCAAIESNITIVINTVERENCTSNNSTGFCPSSGIVYYNTDVAFNEKGIVSGRYRKWNLYGEFPLSQPPEVELVTITTKNNDTFGIFTCFDIMFDKPALELIRNLSVKNILFPTHWFSALPYLTSLQTQQMWAQENNVNFLSAGFNDPNTGSGGSGIFVGERGPLADEIVCGNGTGPTKTIAKRVPRLNVENNPYLNFSIVEANIDELAKDLDKLWLKTDRSVIKHTAVALDLNKTKIVEEICNGQTNKTCCRFNMTINVDKAIQGKYSYVYLMTAFNGDRPHGTYANAGTESCALLACLDNSLSSCGKRFSNYSDIAWPITFESLSVSATFPKDENRVQFPNSLLSSIRPISPQYTTWIKEETENHIERTHSLKKTQNRLLTFGIYGRIFSRDNPSSSQSAKIDNLSFLFLLLMAVF